MRTSSRTPVRTGITAALLPLCLGVPALAGTASADTPSRVGIVGPTTTVSPSRQAVLVSVHDNGAPVAGAKVQLQRETRGGWAPAGTITTDGQGVARGAINFGASMILRAVAPDGISREMLVRVNRPASARLGTAAKANASAGGGFRAAAVRVARMQAGKPYRYGSTGPSSFDCSGLVNYAFRAVGKAVPRTSSALKAWAKPVSKSAAVPGDLIFLPGHVGIYAGNGKMIDAPRSGKTVSLRKIYTSRYTVGRVV